MDDSCFGLLELDLELLVLVDEGDELGQAFVGRFVGARDPLGALFALEAHACAILDEVVVDVADLDDSGAVEGRALNRVAATLHRVVDFLTELELLIAHLAEELHFEDLLLHEAVDFHAVGNSHSASGAVA